MSDFEVLQRGRHPFRLDTAEDCLFQLACIIEALHNGHMTPKQAEAATAVIKAATAIHKDVEMWKVKKILELIDIADIDRATTALGLTVKKQRRNAIPGDPEPVGEVLASSEILTRASSGPFQVMMGRRK